MRALPIILLLMVGSCRAVPPAVVTAGTAPRIVSINPCIDAVLVRVADPAQIGGISHYSQDPRASSMSVALAKRFVATSGTAEEVVALRPDIVLSGGHVDPATIHALQRLGIRLVLFDVPTTIAQSDAQMRAIAAAAGHPERGEALVAETAAAVARAAGARPVPALIWQSGGLVPGAGTLPDELLRVSGFRNLSADYGLKSWDVLPLEYLVAQPPQVLLTVGDKSAEDRMAGNPVIAKLSPRVAVRAFPERLLRCGGPVIAEALDTLVDVRRSL